MYKIRIRCEDLLFANKKMENITQKELRFAFMLFYLFDDMIKFSILYKRNMCEGKTFTCQTFEIELKREFTRDEFISVLKWMKSARFHFSEAGEAPPAKHPVEQMRLEESDENNKRLENEIITRCDFVTGEKMSAPKRNKKKNHSAYNMFVLLQNGKTKTQPA